MSVKKERYHYTYFAAEGNYPKVNTFEHTFYSINYLKNQLWRENSKTFSEYEGWVPFKVLYDSLSDTLVGEKYDLKKSYKNYRHRYERGWYYPGVYRYEKKRDAEGELVKDVVGKQAYKRITIKAVRFEIIPGSEREYSVGNPPPNRDNQAW